MDLIDGEFDRVKPMYGFGRPSSRYEEMTMQDSISNNLMYLRELIQLREKYGLKV